VSHEHLNKFYSDHQALGEFLLKSGELSFAVEAGNNFRRSLVLAVASFFEHEICEIIRQMPAQHANGNSMLTALIEAKAISRQYHAYFDWDNLSANKFFGSFGDACKTAFLAKTKADASFKASVMAFLELGQTRNRLVHRNYVQFDVDKTAEDIYAQFKQALGLLDYIRSTLLPPKPVVLADAAVPIVEPLPATGGPAAMPGDC
jgi:hypothetical protein